MNDEGAVSARPAWTEDVRRGLDVGFPTTPYLVSQVSTTDPPGEELEVTLTGKVSGDARTFWFEGWDEYLDSVGNGGPGELDAFVALLHANLDERWAMTGAGS